MPQIIRSFAIHLAMSQQDENTIDLGSTPFAFGSVGPGKVAVLTGAAGSNMSYTNNTWTTGTNGIDWNTLTVSPSITSHSGVMELRGENADIKINGRGLMDAIEKLEERLNILVPNPELEAEWEELRELGERYRELEKLCKEKGKMWKKLKSMPPPTAE